jgi:hypothetical protein
MRTPETKIKEAILHPVHEIREKALHYFSDARCEDESIMPLVIQAVEKYGREIAFYIMRDAERLPQTEATVDWLINELRRDYDLSDVTQENYCIAVAWVLCSAPPPILWKRFNDIFTATAFPEQLRSRFTERLDRFTWDWDRAWTALKYFGQDTMRRREFYTRDDVVWSAGIVEALARHRKHAKKVLTLLDGQYRDEDPVLMNWLRPCFVDLAGEMQLEEAVPLLIDFVGNEADESMADSADRALQRIGGDVVLRAIDARWWHRENIEFRRAAACILDHVRGDFCIERCLDFFRGEEDRETNQILADALLGNFSEEAVDLIWEFLAGIDDEDLDPEERGLRHRLVAVCTIMGRTFPHFEEWHEAALRDNWGRFGLKTGRVAEGFKPVQFGPKWSEN